VPDVVMPRLSDSMEEGTIVRWLVADGDAVTRGQEIVEIETDKATMSYEADDSGPLHIVAAEGDTLPIGATIATIGAAPADGAGAPAPAAPAAAAPGAAATAAAEASAAPATAAGAPAAAAPGAPTANGASAPRIKASPVARRIAQEHGIDLHKLIGTGPSGRIVKADVVTARTETPSGPAAAPPSPPQAPPPVPVSQAGTARGEAEIVELTRLQQVVARRMAESRSTIPDFTLSTDIDMEGCVALRAQLKELAGSQGVTPSYNDMVVKACALALREHPRANGSYKDATWELHSRVNVGIAVAGDGALVVPTIHDADRKPLGEIARDARALAARVREGKVTPPELSGGTFTVSNLGMFGVTHFTAVINPPQAAILAVGAMEPRAVARDGEVVVRHTMTVTLSCDHRILDGADGARFLARVRQLLEQPLALAL
jgi:pyruvate dehydrogenase E2 component (dihydrolipoamide acetyltransferase)